MALDPTEVFLASSEVSNTFSAMKASYERLTGYTEEAQNMAALAAAEREKLNAMLPEMTAKVAKLNELLQAQAAAAAKT